MSNTSPLINRILEPRELAKIVPAAIALFIMIPVFRFIVWQEMNPEEVIISSGVVLFPSVLLLWILDTTGTLKFEHNWMSKAI